MELLTFNEIIYKWRKYLCLTKETHEYIIDEDESISIDSSNSRYDCWNNCYDESILGCCHHRDLINSTNKLFDKIKIKTDYSFDDLTEYEWSQEITDLKEKITQEKKNNNNNKFNLNRMKGRLKVLLNSNYDVRTRWFLELTEEDIVSFIYDLHQHIPNKFYSIFYENKYLVHVNKIYKETGGFPPCCGQQFLIYILNDLLDRYDYKESIVYIISRLTYYNKVAKNKYPGIRAVTDLNR